MASKNIIFTGIKKLDKRLASIGAKEANRIARKATRAGAKKLQIAMIARAPQDEGLIRKSIKVRAMKRSRVRVGHNALLTDVSFSGEPAFKGRPAFYATFIEFGTRTKKAEPFARPAFDSQKNGVKDALLADIRDGIMSLMRRG